MHPSLSSQHSLFKAAISRPRSCLVRSSSFAYTLYRMPAHIESSPVWDTFCINELIYDLNNGQFLCGKCPKPVTIQYMPPTSSECLSFFCSSSAPDMFNGPSVLWRYLSSRTDRRQHGGGGVDHPTVIHRLSRRL